MACRGAALLFAHMRNPNAEFVVGANLAAWPRVRLEHCSALETFWAVLGGGAVFGAVRRTTFVCDAGQKVAVEIRVATNGILKAIFGLHRLRNHDVLGAIDRATATADIVIAAPQRGR